MDTFQGCTETRRHFQCYCKEAFNSPKTMSGIVFVGHRGLEPLPTEPKSVVLPLHQCPMCVTDETRTHNPLIKSQVHHHYATVAVFIFCIMFLIKRSLQSFDNF